MGSGCYCSVLISLTGGGAENQNLACQACQASHCLPLETALVVPSWYRTRTYT